VEVEEEALEVVLVVMMEDLVEVLEEEGHLEEVDLEDLDQEVEDSLEDLVEDRLEAEKIKTERKRRHK